MILRNIPSNRTAEFGNLVDYVRSIVEYVRAYGDKALIELTRKYDRIDIDSIKLDHEDLEKCAEALPDDVKRSIDIIYSHLYSFNSIIMPSDIKIELNGMILGIIWRSIDRIGIYVPGGRRAYPSTLFMAGVPAVVAGVKEVYISSPPTGSGCINPAIAYGALKLSAKGVYRIGGPHAIAAMAYGTESVVKVSKIVGPGNIYVQIAKYLVRDNVDIDCIEGPTELVIVADSNADYRKIVVDMKAQAEHGGDTFIALLTPSSEIIEEVEKELLNDTEHTYYIVMVRDIDEAIEIANSLAPEHLSLYVKDPHSYLDKIRNAGAVTLGSEPPALVDYLGPNHILPTNGWARTRGALSVYDFLKPIATLYSSRTASTEIISAAKSLAEYEGFLLHRESMGVGSVQHIK